MSNQGALRSVFVGNIPYDATEEQLKQICEEVGPVVSFRLVVDRETGKPKGFGFCEYKDEETAQSARRNLQGYEINGRQLRVDFAENEKGTGVQERSQARGAIAPSSLNSLTGAGQHAPSVSQQQFLQPHTPMGHAMAAAAASTVAGALNSPGGPPAQANEGSAGLTNQLAGMSKQQLYELLAQMKVLIQTNHAQARSILVANPQLAKGLFQAQVMLGMVKPMPPGAALQSPTQSIALQQGQPAAHPQVPAAHQQLPPGAQPQIQPMAQPPLPQQPRPVTPQTVSTFQVAQQQGPPGPQTQPQLVVMGQQGPTVQMQQPPHVQQQQPQPQANLGVPPGMGFPPGHRPPAQPQAPHPRFQPPGGQVAPPQGMPMQYAQQPTPQSHLPPQPAHAPVGSMYQYGPVQPHDQGPGGHLQPPPVGPGQRPGMGLPGTIVPPPHQSHPSFMPLGSQFGGTPMQGVQMPGAAPPMGPGGQPLYPGGPTPGSIQGPAPPQPYGQVAPQTFPQVPPVQQGPLQQAKQQPQPPQVSMDLDQQKALLQQVMNLTQDQINSLPPDQRAQVLQLQQALR